MTLLPRQFVASVILSICLLVLIIRLVQKGRLDIAYCWLWLFIGAGIMLVVLRYDWLIWVSGVIGAVNITTTLFLFGFFVLLLMCLQFSLVISHHRRQIKRLTQDLASIQADIQTAGSQEASPDPAEDRPDS